MPLWQPVRAWRLATPGIPVETAESPEERTTRWRAPSGTLQARWTLGPDGDWWQAEYPVKDAGDLAAAAQIVAALVYRPEPSRLQVVEGGGLTVVELPMRPYSDLLHSFLGFGEGFLLLYQEPERIAGMLAALEAKLQGLIGELAGLRFEAAFSPDNLDAQFIPPPAFAEHLAPSYQATADTLHAAGKLLAVHAGGPVASLLPALAAAGADLVEGISGPPQSDASLSEARALCGQAVTLWGGIPQDLLLPATAQGEFEEAARRAVAEVRGDPRALLGVADRVPVGALPGRLELLARLAAQG